MKLKIVLLMTLATSSVFAQENRVFPEEVLRENPAYETVFNGAPAPTHIQKERAELRRTSAKSGFAERYAVGDTPIIYSGGVVNVFDSVYQNRLASGEFVSIYGLNFANFGVSAPPGNLPKELNGVRVSVNGVFASLSYVGPGQINAQMPYGIPTFGNSSIKVIVGTKESAPFIIANSTVAPVLYKLGGNVYTQNQFGQPVGMPGYPTLVTGSQPVATVHYASGLGLTNPFVDAGQVTFGPSYCTNSMVVQSTTATGLTVSYCGLSPGSVGLGQINLIWPANTPTGTHSVQLRHGGVDIPVFYVTVVRQ